MDNFTEIDGGPYPSSSRGPIYTFNEATTYLKGRHTLKAGVRSSIGRGRLRPDQCQPIPAFTNNQNGRFQFTNASAGANSTGVSIANAAMGLFTNYSEIGHRALTKWRSLSTDMFVQDTWQPANNLTVEGGVRWAYWPPWYALENNAASFSPAYYSTSIRRSSIRPPAASSRGPRYNGIVLPGDGFPSSASDLADYNDPAVNALFVGVPRGFADTHANTFEPRLGHGVRLEREDDSQGEPGVFHNRVTLNDSMLLGGNPPFQPQVVGQQRHAEIPAAPVVQRPCRSA